jgi:hypothetical protein
VLASGAARRSNECHQLSLPTNTDLVLSLDTRARALAQAWMAGEYCTRFFTASWLQKKETIHARPSDSLHHSFSHAWHFVVGMGRLYYIVGLFLVPH